MGQLEEDKKDIRAIRMITTIVLVGALCYLIAAFCAGTMDVTKMNKEVKYIVAFCYGGFLLLYGICSIPVKENKN